jgi:pilus assembly protein Flp/PilA
MAENPQIRDDLTSGDLHKGITAKADTRNRGKPPMKRRNLMKSLAQKLNRFLISEDGPTAVEYAVMLALIIIVCLTAISSLGQGAKNTFQGVSNSLP